MSSKNPTSRNRKGAAPEWDEKWMRERTRRLVFAGIGVIAGIWIFLLIWLLFFADVQDAVPRTLQQGVDLAVVLAPVIAAAAGVERLLETGFNSVEGAWRSLVAYLGYGFRWLKTAETEVAEARDWLHSMGAVYNGTLATNNQKMSAIFAEHKQQMLATLRETANDAPDPRLKDALLKMSDQIDALPSEMLSKMMDLLVTPPDLPLPASVQQRIDDVRSSLIKNLETLRAEAESKTAAARDLLKKAEARMKDAEDKLANATASDDYRSAKGAITIILGLMLGVIVAGLGQIQMFALLGIGVVPARIDVLVTGLVIGSGSYPVHSLVGILQQGKDALDSVGNYLNKRSKPAEPSGP